MVKEIEEHVAENRRDVQRLDSRFVLVPERVEDNLRFLRNEFTVAVDVTVYERSLNSTLISGHSDGSTHGSGHGESGDARGGWTQVASGSNTAAWTRGGRNAARDALDGQDSGGIGSVAVGTGTAGADPLDTTLATETGSTFAYGLKDAANEIRARSHFLFHEADADYQDLQEVGLESQGGSLMARLTTSAISTDETTETRVDISVTVEGDGAGQSVITDAGEEAVADSIQIPSTSVGLQSIAWGTGTPTVDESATSLANQVLQKDAVRGLGLERIELSSPQFDFEPNSQPHDYTEAGVFDNSGNLVWLVDYSGDPVTKDDQTRFTTIVGFRIR